MLMFIFSDPFFARVFLGNPLESYVWVILILLAGLIFKRYISKFLSAQLFRICKKYATGVGPGKFIELLIAPFNLFVMLLIFYLAFDRLNFPEEWHLVPDHVFGLRMFIYRAYLVMLVIAVTWIFLRLTDYFGLVLLHRASLTDSKADDQLVPFIKESIKIVIALISFFFMLGSVFNVNVASLVAGLGIGGLAVALAAKESLENLLGSFTIFLDKPFTIGDLIKIDNMTGHVEKIGFRSTRIRTADKTFVTVPNKKMVDAELENLSLRNLYRARFTIGITYDADKTKLMNLISGIKHLLGHEPMITADYAVHFTDFNASSLDILIIYFVKTADWETYIAVKEKINFGLLELVGEHGCAFAYPTSRVLLENTVIQK